MGVCLASLLDPAVTTVFPTPNHPSYPSNRTTLGMVCLYAEELTQKLTDTMLASIERNKGKSQTVDKDYGNAAEQALDDFFGSGDKK